MSRPVLRIAVVGHTNTGKTSLLRTLTRDVEFGDVSDHPAVTRHVEGTRLVVDGQEAVELYDTPGLEDSIGLLEHLDGASRDRREDDVAVIERFLESDAARGVFSQEAKALRQLMSSDIALYVIDARDRVLGKHRDELEILSRCARPVVPVLNFTATTESRADEWRDQLARLKLHAVAEFDTVVFNAVDERRLFEKIATLADRHRPTLEALINERRRHRAMLVEAASEQLADLLIDVAAYVRIVPHDDAQAQEQAQEAMRMDVREQEHRCIEHLLELFQFRAEDCRMANLPIEDGQWGMDLFHPDALRDFGMRAGSGAAAGALAGLAVDAMVGGITLGAAAATGAAIGAVLGAGRGHAKRLVDRVRGMTELRVAEPTLRLLAARQLALIEALLVRGHASQQEIDVEERARAVALEDVLGKTLPKSLRSAMGRPAWSRLGTAAPGLMTDAARREAVSELAKLLEVRVDRGQA